MIYTGNSSHLCHKQVRKICNFISQTASCETLWLLLGHQNKQIKDWEFYSYLDASLYIIYENITKEFPEIESGTNYWEREDNILIECVCACVLVNDVNDLFRPL